MKYLIFYEKFLNNHVDIRKSIKYSKKIPHELKEIALDLIGPYTKAKNGKITGLKLHPDLIRKINKGGYPSGFDMGIDKDGYFIHTHRARSKSYETPKKISVKDIKFIDSTG